MLAARAANPTEAQPAQQDEDKIVRLHVTPLKPDLLKVYLAPSVLPLAKKVSYHTVETFPEKSYGYLELPESEAQKLKKKLNGTTLRGAKVRIEMAKTEKRKALAEADAAKDKEEAERPSKRVKKERRKKEQGVLEGAELENDRKVKRGWTEPPSKSKKDRKEKKGKDEEHKHEQKKSKYTKEPEMLFKAKLTPVAATEVARKEKRSDKKEKKEKKRSKAKEVVVHEFEKNTKTPSFLKETKVSTEKKPAVEYVNGQGWVDEDGNVVEPETGKAKNRRVLELVDKPADPEKIDGFTPKTSSKSVTKAPKKKVKVTPPPESEDEDDSSVVSSSSEDVSSDSEAESSDAESTPSTPVPAVNGTNESADIQPAASAEKEVHPLEALFKRPKPTPGPLSISTPKKLTPITTSFSFFDADAENMEVDQVGQPVDNGPVTPYTERDIEWRGLRSAAPTPDTAAIGRRFSFDWRKGSQEADGDEDEDMEDPEAEQQLSKNTKANAVKSKLAGVAEENGEDVDAGEAMEAGAEEKPESEFRKWFWENRGDLNRAWKKRRRDALKAKRHTENKKMTPHRRVG
ncbi:hypothetical protein EK21DRAFT_93814 [Setomelanomma holmii]|uniref:Uncharacterized protein n=1 Tax=Setomelanomma holmii TaxID=210430 RepID=A0A9P4H0F1_9PLEO|nr:hypothetical protein EK21DRAFT_93814 [Setomelanomma holmii]